MTAYECPSRGSGSRTWVSGRPSSPTGLGVPERLSGAAVGRSLLLCRPHSSAFAPGSPPGTLARVQRPF